MPPIDPERWRELEPLLDHALTLAPEERAAWLESLRAHSPELATGLGALLSGEDRADQRGFLSEPPAMSLAGLELGAYTLERPLGQGGMGSVWLARRADGRFEGRAAVKLMNLGLLSPTGQERFRREGTALARLTHPASLGCSTPAWRRPASRISCSSMWTGSASTALPIPGGLRPRSGSVWCSRCSTR